MKTYRVLRIDEEDFGCEGRPEGYEPQCLVFLQNKCGEPSMAKIPDAWLYEEQIEEGSQVYADESGTYHLLKQDSESL